MLHLLLADVFGCRPPNHKFHTTLMGDIAKRNKLVKKVAFMQLDDKRGLIKWNMKIKVLIWFLTMKVILTKNNFIK